METPYWRRARHDWHFWVAVVTTFAAIAMYVMSDDLALIPRTPPEQLHSETSSAP